VRRLVLLLALLPTLAWAEAPFDRAALQAKWPGADAVYLSKSLVFSMPDPETLRVETKTRLALLSDSAREDLVLFTTSRRPGCRDPKDIAISVTDARGDEVPWDGVILELPSGNHPVKADRSSVTLSASRRGLGAGALLEESWVVDYAAGCFDGLLATERVLADPSWPIEALTVDVPCAGEGCAASLDLPFVSALQPREGGGQRIVATDVPAPPAEFRVPSQGMASVIVATSEDPLALGQLLRRRLLDEASRRDEAVPDHRRRARGAFPHEGDEQIQVARYLTESLPRMDGGAFWQFGFDWGTPVSAGRRPLLPLEWWALAHSMLWGVDGIPLLLDTESIEDLPDIGRVVSFDRVGVLIPGKGLVTDQGWFPTTGEPSTASELKESHPELAGRWAMTLDGEPRLVRFPERDGLATYDVVGTMTATSGSSLILSLDRTYGGATGATLDTLWGDELAEWAERDRRTRDSKAETERAFANEYLLRHEASDVEIDVDRAAGTFTLGARTSRRGLVQHADEVVVVAPPVDLDEDLLWLVNKGDGGPRSADFELSVLHDTLDIEIVGPPGTRLAGLPPAADVVAGPVSLSVRWTETENGARLEYVYRISQRIVPAAHADGLHRVGEELRRLRRTRLLFVPE